MKKIILAKFKMKAKDKSLVRNQINKKLSIKLHKNKMPNNKLNYSLKIMKIKN